MQGPLTIAISLGAQDVTGQRIWAYTQPTDPAQVTRKDYVDARTPQITVATTPPSNPAVGDLFVNAT